MIKKECKRGIWTGAVMIGIWLVAVCIKPEIALYTVVIIGLIFFAGALVVPVGAFMVIIPLYLLFEWLSNCGEPEGKNGSSPV